MAKAKTLKVKILLPVAGVYLLSDNVGDVVSYAEPLATEMVESKHAEFVVSKKATPKKETAKVDPETKK